jgi:thymidine phosphorylase
VRIDDKIDPTVGFTAEKKIGDQIDKGELLGTVYARDQSQARETAARIQAAYRVAEASDSQQPTLIKEVINE